MNIDEINDQQSETDPADAQVEAEEPAKKTLLSRKSAKRWSLKAWAGKGGLATIGGAIGFFQIFMPQPPAPFVTTDCTVLSDRTMESILDKAKTPQEAAEYARALRCEAFPNFTGLLVENSEEQRFEDSVAELAQSKDRTKRQGLVLAADPSTRSDGLDLLAEIAVSSNDWKQIGELAYPWDVSRAIKAYETAIDLGEQEVWTTIYLSRLWTRAGDLARAEARLKKLNLSVLPQRDQSVIQNDLGNIATAQGNLAEAKDRYEESLNIAKSLAEQDPKNAEYKRDLMVSYYKLAQAVPEKDTFYYKKAYAELKALSDAGRMNPTDQIWLNDLKEKLRED